MPADRFTPDEELAAARAAVPEEFSDEAEWYIASLREKGLIEEVAEPTPLPSGAVLDEDEAIAIPTAAPYPEFIIIQTAGHAATVSVAECMTEDGNWPIVYELIADKLQRERATDFVRSLDSHA